VENLMNIADAMLIGGRHMVLLLFESAGAAYRNRLVETMDRCLFSQEILADGTRPSRAALMFFFCCRPIT